MAHFYGTLQGARGQATRCGTKGSGITTVAASWKGAVQVILEHDEDTRDDRYYVSMRPWHGKGSSRVIAEGIVGE